MINKNVDVLGAGKSGISELPTNWKSVCFVGDSTLTPTDYMSAYPFSDELVLVYSVVIVIDLLVVRVVACAKLRMIYIKVNDVYT